MGAGETSRRGISEGVMAPAIFKLQVPMDRFDTAEMPHQMVYFGRLASAIGSARKPADI
jgi:hypothetical protein